MSIKQLLDDTKNRDKQFLKRRVSFCIERKIFGTSLALFQCTMESLLQRLTNVYINNTLVTGVDKHHSHKRKVVT